MTIINALLPVFVTLLIGYLAAWRHDEDGKTATALNKMVMTFTLPLVLFAGTVTISRKELVQNLPMMTALTVGLLVPFGVALAVIRYGFKRPLGESTLQALAISFPAVPFIGIPVLGSIFGAQAATITVAISGLGTNLIIVPISIVLLTLAVGNGEGAKADGGQPASSAATEKISISKEQTKDKGKPSGGNIILSTIEEPVVWAPVLAIVFVLVGIPVPKPVVTSLQLLGATTSGISLFASGIILRAQKPTISIPIAASTLGRLVVVPGLALVLLPLFGIVGKARSESVVALSMPCAVMLIILSVRYRIAEKESASVLLYSYVFSAGSMTLAVLLTR